MKLLVIEEREAGQRLDKYLDRYLTQATKSFLYKMLRKKNITLNGKKCEGNEKLSAGDEIRIFFSEETLEKMTGRMTGHEAGNVPGKRYGNDAGELNRNDNEILSGDDSEKGRKYAGKQGVSRQCVGQDGDLRMFQGHRISDLIIYEDEHILLFNKPAGMLSQKSVPEDVSAIEYLTGYLKEKGELTDESYQRFHPAVCNRIDRNTSGLLIFGKSMTGLQNMSAVLRDRSIHKDYCCIVKGSVTGENHIRGYLIKDRDKNVVTISPCSTADAEYIETRYIPIRRVGDATVLKVRLITGKSHQIRAHLASVGHPILGDYKYGDRKTNDYYKHETGLTYQLLHAWELTMPELIGSMSYLSGKCFTAPLPELFAIVERAATDKRNNRR